MKDKSTVPQKHWEWKVGRFLTLSTSPKRLIFGGIFTALLLAFVLFHTDEFLQRGLSHGVLLFVLSLLACVVLGALALVRSQLTDRPATVVSIVVFCLLPIVAMTMVECLNGIFTWDWSPQTLILNYILYFLFYGLVYICSGSFRLPMLICNPLFFALGLTHYYVYAMRGTPFVPGDLFAAGTAANVVIGYDFSFNFQIVIAVLMLIFLEIAAFKIRTPKMDIVIKVASRVFFGTLIACIVGIYAFTDLYAQAGLKPDFWNQARGYHNTGVVMNFCLNIKYLHFSKPEGYNADAIDSIVYGVLEEESENGDAVGISTMEHSPATPNIICIMNESLADMNVLGDVKTNIDYMPFLHRLSENTVKGNLYVPVVGSGTSNTEFEFLTGASTAFFPAGSNAYMLYVKNPLYSLVSTLSSQGYSKTAFHPYYASGWNRTNVYRHFGFDAFHSITSVIDSSILNEYQTNGFNATLLENLVKEAYPGQNILVRRYVSDECNYDKLIAMYEKRSKNEPFFLFNVTMQNHGSYTEQAENFDQEVYLVDEAGKVLSKENAEGQLVMKYPKANQFYSLMKKSDEAFEELLDYFSRQDEPTVICLFGDHQPSIESEYIRELMGVDSLYNLSTEQNENRYITPFYIWANYDIEEKTIDKLSVNYLSSYLLDIAGVEMPTFNRYLLKLSEQIPVINPIGYMDAQGNCYENGAKSPYSDLIKGYEKVVYNYIFDKDNKRTALYSID